VCLCRWDEFDGNSLDTNKWSYDLGTGDWGWGNNESEVGGGKGAGLQAAWGLLYKECSLAWPADTLSLLTLRTSSWRPPAA